nr:MAG TPA: hypothetical protein [Caudoviricetes sp.]
MLLFFRCYSERRELCSPLGCLPLSPLQPKSSLLC